MKSCHLWLTIQRASFPINDQDLQPPFSLYEAPSAGMMVVSTEHLHLLGFHVALHFVLPKMVS